MENTCASCGTECLDHTSNKGRGSESPCSVCEENRCKHCPCECEEASGFDLVERLSEELGQKEERIMELEKETKQKNEILKEIGEETKKYQMDLMVLDEIGEQVFTQQDNVYDTLENDIIPFAYEFWNSDYKVKNRFVELFCEKQFPRGSWSIETEENVRQAVVDAWDEYCDIHDIDDPDILLQEDEMTGWRRVIQGEICDDLYHFIEEEPDIPYDTIIFLPWTNKEGETFFFTMGGY
jgi:hypothetical protein